LNPAGSPAFGDRRTICRSLNFVGIQVALEEANWLSAKCSLHLSHAAVTEIQAHTTVTIVVLLSELV